MIAYMNIITQDFPLYEGDVRLDYPEIRDDQTGDSFPNTPTYAKVSIPDMPDHNPTTHKAQLLPPTISLANNSQFTSLVASWCVIELTDSEKVDSEKAWWDSIRRGGILPKHQL